MESEAVKLETREASCEENEVHISKSPENTDSLQRLPDLKSDESEDEEDPISFAVENKIKTPEIVQNVLFSPKILHELALDMEELKQAMAQEHSLSDKLAEHFQKIQFKNELLTKSLEQASSITTSSNPEIPMTNGTTNGQVRMHYCHPNAIPYPRPRAACPQLVSKSHAEQKKTTREWLFPVSDQTLYSSDEEAGQDTLVLSKSGGTRYTQISQKDFAKAIESESENDTEKLLNGAHEIQRSLEIPELRPEQFVRRPGKVVALEHPQQPDQLIRGLLFHVSYMGSTQLLSEPRPTKYNRMKQAQEAVDRIKAPSGESQPSVPVDLFVAIEKVIVLGAKEQEIMMDHDLNTISYIADIGDLLVAMVRRSSPEQQGSENGTIEKEMQRARSTKMLCHVFRTDKAQAVAHAIGEAFNIAYHEYLEARGLTDPRLTDSGPLDYQEVLNQQEVFGDELEMFSDREKQKEIIISKAAGEPLGVAIIESGCGSLLPTAMLANMNPSGPAARSGTLNIGNQIISVNGQSLVGLKLAECEQIFKTCRNQSAVKLVVVDSCPVIEVLIRRPDRKYQLGFSVKDGIICTLIRGGIAERGGVRVDHRIIEINGESVVTTSHERIVFLLDSAIGEIYLRTMPAPIFLLLTGQEEPHYV
ncbi:hypothetical protein Ciccas_006743 [Cichlidogyrus casuarinus]|uniref:Uncharacterized protein n=1 Tax=Cichlidogyrus casuarinus TaxID=1844966 RepID=A0ABD2Q5H8_9PLAT